MPPRKKPDDPGTAIEPTTGSSASGLYTTAGGGSWVSPPALPAALESVDAEARYTHGELVAMGMGKSEINSLLDAGLVKDAEQAIDKAPPVYLVPATLDDVAAIVKRVKRIEDDLAALKKQQTRRLARLNDRLKFYKSHVYPLCVTLVQKSLPVTGDEKFVERADVRLQLKTYQGSVSLEDPRAFIGYMESLERDLIEVQERLVKLTALTMLTEEEAATLQASFKEQDALIHRLDGLRAAFSLKIISTEELTGAEAWEAYAEPPGDVETYEPSLNADAVLDFVRSYPVEVTGQDAEGNDILLPFTPPGIKRVETRTELYGA